MDTLLTSLSYLNQKNIKNRKGRTYYLSLSILLNCSLLSAEETIIYFPTSGTNTSIINAPVSSGSLGVSTVNISSGNNNLQANVGVVTIGANAERTNTTSIIIQENQNNYHQSNDKSTASISGHAFSNNKGWTAINQVSGVANSQANMMEIGIGEEYEIGTINDQILAQSFSDTGESDLSATNPNSARSTNIDDTAMSGMSGVIQVNQTAGSGNTTSNTFVFQVNGL